MSLDEAEKEIIKYQWSDNVLVYSDIGTECDEGAIIKYNFIIIERELAHRLVMNKAILTDGTVFSPFTFTDEVVHSCSSLLRTIPQSIPQQGLSDEMVCTIQNKEITFISDLLEHLEIILVLLKKTGGSPLDSLDAYLKRWNTQLPKSFPPDLLPEPRSSIQLAHVVSLYKTLEDHFADKFVESLDNTFRQLLPATSSDVLLNHLQELDIKEMEKMLTTIRRFVFRCLRNSNSVDQDTIDSKLLEVMRRSAMDDEYLQCVDPILSKTPEICVKHVYYTQEFIDNQIQVLLLISHSMAIKVKTILILIIDYVISLILLF